MKVIESCNSNNEWNNVQKNYHLTRKPEFFIKRHFAIVFKGTRINVEIVVPGNLVAFQ